MLHIHKIGENQPKIIQMGIQMGIREMIVRPFKWSMFVACLIFVSSTIAENIRFVDITDQAGLTHSGDSWGIAWGDFNNDGLPDIYDGNHRERPAFFINQGDGTFQNHFNEVFSHNNLEDFIDTHGAQWVDLNNDGFSDLIVQVGGNGGGLALAWNNTQILMNRNGKLDQRAEELGLANPEFRGRTPLAFDYDRNGLLDILFTNICLLFSSSSFWAAALPCHRISRLQKPMHYRIQMTQLLGDAAKT